MQRRGESGQSVKGKRAPGPKARKAPTVHASSPDLQAELDRRTRERDEALEQQAATSEVLQVISRSTFDLQTVLDTLVESAARLCEAEIANIWRPKDGVYRLAASYGVTSRYKEYLENKKYLETVAIEPGRGTIVGRTLFEGKTVHVHDVQSDPEYNLSGVIALGGYRSTLGVPLLREGNPIGVLFLSRTRVEPFTKRQIDLVNTFADQAVIAIENVRLFEAEQERTRELAEALEQQTATSEVLQVISSSPGELEPVFNAMLENATRICEAKLGNLFLYERNCFRAVAVHGDSQYADWTRRDPVVDMSEAEHFGVPLHRITRSKTLVHIPDIRLDESYIGGNARIRSLADTAGARTHLVVPMLKDDELIGAIVMYRQEVRPFSDKQIALIQSFASQAVIAIENTRLLSELRESLQQQTATADVLKVISSSPGELEPVFNAMLANAVQICEATFGMLFRVEDGVVRPDAMMGVPPAFAEFWQRGPQRPGRRTALGRTIETEADHPYCRRHERTGLRRGRIRLCGRRQTRRHSVLFSTFQCLRIIR